MGMIIANNLINNRVIACEITVVKPSSDNKIKNIKYFDDFKKLPKNYQPDLVFIAIKPQESLQILKNFVKSQRFSRNTIFISILAGKKIAFFSEIFGKNAKIIRSMPNLPIEDQQGIFAYHLNQNIKKSEISILNKLFNNFGLAIKLKDENLFDAVTAIFGSGPAYIFYLQEIFVQLAIKAGFASSDAEELVKKLFLGSALMACNSDLNFLQLHKSVTSKKGTTEAALQVLQKDDAAKNLFSQAINQAINKSKDLSR